MKKILSISVAVALLASVCSIFFTTAAEDTATSFTAQHAYVDFEKYEINATRNHLKNVDLKDNQWSVSGDDSNKSLQFKFRLIILTNQKVCSVVEDHTVLLF